MRRSLKPIILGCGLVMAWGSALAGNDAIYERADGDGAVELTNIPTDDPGYQSVAAPAASDQASTTPKAEPNYRGQQAPADVADPSAALAERTPQGRAARVREQMQSLYGASRAAWAAHEDKGRQ